MKLISRKTLLLILKYLLAIAIVYILSKSKLINFAVLKSIDLKDACVALSLISIQLILSGYRVQILLKYHQINIGLIKCVTYNSLGIFYSLFLPGGMSGDLARAFYFWKECPGASKSSLLGALFMDRLLGTVAMLLIGLVAGTYLISELNLHQFVILSWAGFAFFCLVYFIIMRFYPTHATTSSIRGKLLRFIQSINVKSYSLSVLTLASVISFTAHLCAIFVIYICSDIAMSGLNFSEVLTVAPLGLLANALPLTPGGIGVGEQGFELLYQLVGGVEGANSFLLSRLFLYSPALLGAGFLAVKFIVAHFDFLFTRKHDIKAD